MEENRYYKPSFDEIFVGLEYEFQSENGWKKWQISENTDFGRFRHMLKTNKIRVKKLDVECFSDLGFIKTASVLKKDDFLGEFYDIYIGEDLNLVCHHYYNINTVSFCTKDFSKIVKRDLKGYSILVDPFQINCIKIKNKSELKRLLTQLGVYDN